MCYQNVDFKPLFQGFFNKGGVKFLNVGYFKKISPIRNFWLKICYTTVVCYQNVDFKPLFQGFFNKGGVKFLNVGYFKKISPIRNFWLKICYTTVSGRSGVYLAQAVFMGRKVNMYPRVWHRGG